MLGDATNRGGSGTGDVDDVAGAWLKYYDVLEKAGDLGGRTSVADEYFWATERIDEMVRHDPEGSWRLIMELVLRAHSDYQLAALAAGPLEDLLVKHGRDFIERVERAAANSERFRETLVGVWRNEMPDDVWSRIEAARGTSEASR